MIVSFRVWIYASIGNKCAAAKTSALGGWCQSSSSSCQACRFTTYRAQRWWKLRSFVLKSFIWNHPCLGSIQEHAQNDDLVKSGHRKSVGIFPTQKSFRPPPLTQSSLDVPTNRSTVIVVFRDHPPQILEFSDPFDRPPIYRKNEVYRRYLNLSWCFVDCSLASLA